MEQSPNVVRAFLLAPKSAFRFGAALLLALLLIIALALIDRLRERPLEQFLEISAVGDTVYFGRPALDNKAAFAEPVAVLDGVPLYIVDGNKRELKDTNMVRVGRDAASGLSIYTPRKKDELKPSADSERVYFVKLGRNDYLQVRRR